MKVAAAKLCCSRLGMEKTYPFLQLLVFLFALRSSSVRECKALELAAVWKEKKS